MALLGGLKCFIAFLLLNIIVDISLCQRRSGGHRSDTPSGIEDPLPRQARRNGGDTDITGTEDSSADVHYRGSAKPEASGYSLGWKAGGGNCSCANEMTGLRRDLTSEIEERKALKKALDTYITELYQLRTRLRENKTHNSQAPKSLPLTTRGVVSFSAKLSYNRELKPLDTVIFDTVLSNAGQAYDADTGIFTAPLSGTYMFHSTVLSGYNTKVETAIIVNDKEVARIYSGAHDAHGSGSNMAILDLHTNDHVWVRLLYQGGNHIHGYYSTFSGAMLAETEL